jgi:hypothetical protein
MPQPCALYARASTSKVEQAKSVPDQLAECRRYARRIVIRIVVAIVKWNIRGFRRPAP